MLNISKEYIPQTFSHCSCFIGLAGLAVTYGLTLNTMQAWVVWNLCVIESKIISIERIFQYTGLPSEPPLVIESNRPDCNWPSCGEVDFSNLQVN